MTTPVYDTAATFDLVEALRQAHGPDIAAAHRALAANAHPDTRLLDLTSPELDGFPFPALAYAATTALAPGSTTLARLGLLQDLMDRGADRAQTAAFLLAVYSNLWESHPRTARRMVIGLHTLHNAVEPYVAGTRTLPYQLPIAAKPEALAPITRDRTDEIPF